jgi:hypothetical protein
MASYEVLEVAQQERGWIVTFSVVRSQSWWDRLLHRAPSVRTLKTHTEHGVIWRRFPSMKRIGYYTESALEDAFKRYQLLQEYSSEQERA